MRISVAIEHHPSRVELASALAAKLAPLEVEIVADPIPDDPTPATWRTYRRALDETPAGATHRVVIQDDAVPCAGFAALLERAVAARPTELLVLCVCGNARLLGLDLCAALARGEAFVELRRERITFVPAVAVVWPVELAERVLAYVDAQARWEPYRLADDEVIYRAVTALGIVPVATVPSIIDHPDLAASIIGVWKPAHGRNLSRTTVCFDDDGSRFDP